MDEWAWRKGRKARWKVQRLALKERRRKVYKLAADGPMENAKRKRRGLIKVHRAG